MNAKAWSSELPTEEGLYLWWEIQARPPVAYSIAPCAAVGRVMKCAPGLGWPAGEGYLRCEGLLNGPTLITGNPVFWHRLPDDFFDKETGK